MIEQPCGWLADGVEQKLVEPHHGIQRNAEPQGVAGKVRLWEDFAEKRDAYRLKKQSADSGEQRVGE
jgi:hypothetical protein